MKVSISWLKRHVDLPESVEEIEAALTSVGLEVEGKEEPGKVYEKLVVAKVLTCENHPDSDHLHVTTVDTGSETLQIVCGAPNVAAGQTVVVAPIGMELPLPDGTMLKMKKAKMRGIESFGMICAEDEIGLSDDHAGIMVLDDSIPAGTPFVSLGLYDAVLEVNVTPNRPDALSHRGIARELAAKFNRPLKPLSYSLKESSVSVNSRKELSVEPGAGCSRYVGRIIENVKVAPSPAWLSKLLHAVGLNSVNNVVDITNFVLMDVGQPLHSFDMSRLEGSAVKVRKANVGESITTIDHTVHELKESDLVICDGNRPACVAGVMGGVESEITEETTNVFLESAYFDPKVVRRQSKRLGLSSDSSYRFERGIDPFTQAEMNDYACALIQEVAGGDILQGRLEYTGDDAKREPDVLEIREERVQKLLGISISADQIKNYLESIGLKEVAPLRFEIPGFRPDLEREVDLIEEVARLFGYDNIPYDLPSFKMATNELPADEKLNRKIRSTLSAMGIHEGLSLRFTSKTMTTALFGENVEGDRRSMPAALLNPLSEDLGVLPTSLLPNLLKAVAENEKNRPGSVRLFEVGKGQFKTIRESVRDTGFNEVPLLAITLAGHWKTNPLEEKPAPVSFLDFKGLILGFFKRLGIQASVRLPKNPERFMHPAQQAEVVCGKIVLGTAGVLHPAVQKEFDIGYASVCVAEFDISKIELASKTSVAFEPFSRQVPSSRDISLEVSEQMMHETILARIKGFNPKNLADIRLKSIYQGDKLEAGKKNLVYTLVYQASDRTLTDEEVNKVHNKLREKLVADGDIVLR